MTKRHEIHQFPKKENKTELQSYNVQEENKPCTKMASMATTSQPEINDNLLDKRSD